jgi:hypothetical protein
MGVLKSTRTSLLLKDSLRKSELALKRLTSVPRGFSQKEEVDLVEVYTSIFGGFEEHGRDTHDWRLEMALYGLIHAP